MNIYWFSSATQWNYTTINRENHDKELNIFSYLSIKDLIHCGLVSKRIRRLSRDEFLWKKVNLCGKIVPSDFLKYILDNGCRYLNLAFSEIRGSLKLLNNCESKMTGKYKVKYLNLSNCSANYGVIEELISSCQVTWWCFEDLIVP